jgi:hypothetical protein
MSYPKPPTFNQEVAGSIPAALTQGITYLAETAKITPVLLFKMDSLELKLDRAAFCE